MDELPDEPPDEPSVPWTINQSFVIWPCTWYLFQKLQYPGYIFFFFKCDSCHFWQDQNSLCLFGEPWTQVCLVGFYCANMIVYDVFTIVALIVVLFSTYLQNSILLYTFTFFKLCQMPNLCHWLPPETFGRWSPWGAPMSHHPCHVPGPCLRAGERQHLRARGRQVVKEKRITIFIPVEPIFYTPKSRDSEKTSRFGYCTSFGPTTLFCFTCFSLRKSGPNTSSNNSSLDSESHQAIQTYWSSATRRRDPLTNVSCAGTLLLGFGVAVVLSMPQVVWHRFTQSSSLQESTSLVQLTQSLKVDENQWCISVLHDWTGWWWINHTKRICLLQHNQWY